MKIHNNNINKMLNVYQNQATTNKSKESQKAKKTDSLNISSEARDFQIAMETIKNQAEVRMEKVEKIRKQVESGVYKVDAKAISEKMMRDANIYTRM